MVSPSYKRVFLFVVLVTRRQELLLFIPSKSWALGSLVKNTLILEKGGTNKVSEGKHIQSKTERA